MSFGITSAGTKEQVLEDISSTDFFNEDNEQWKRVATFLREELTHATKDVILEAYGHQDQHTLSLSISLKTIWRPMKVQEAK